MLRLIAEAIEIKPGLLPSRYGNDKQWKAINYYSNPGVSFEGKATGDANNDNAKMLNQMRFLYEKIGDEDVACPANFGM